MSQPSGCVVFGWRIVKHSAFLTVDFMEKLVNDKRSGDLGRPAMVVRFAASLALLSGRGLPSLVTFNNERFHFVLRTKRCEMFRIPVPILLMLVWLATVGHAMADEKNDYVKKAAPEVVGGYTLDELYKAQPDAKKGTLTRNSDNTQELTWGDNLANSHVMLGDGKVVMLRRKVIRANRAAVEKESLAPVATLGKPRSTGVPDDEPDTVSCNVWIVGTYWYRTAIIRGKTIMGEDVFFAESYVIDLAAIDRLRKK